ncbi:MAG TPA: dihydroorotase [Candidatus Scybalocola faecavium]|nr:dihydroorotase [Candidatus Scybalocola faecavium]
MSLLIKGGRLIDPATKRDDYFDVLVKDGKVCQVEKNLDPSCGDQVLDAKGCYVVPGLIDLHVHLREPGFEYKETIKTGAMAAAKGGYTSICPMPNTKPVIDSPEMIGWLKDKAKTDAVVNIWPVGAVTRGQMGKELADIAGMAQAGAVAISEDGKSVMDTKLYKEAMVQAREAGITVLAHCEDKTLVGQGALNAGPVAEKLGVAGIGNDVEDIIAARDIILAKSTGCRLHLCHCSTKDSVTMVREAKADGVQVSGEVCPHHFVLTQDDIPGDDANYKMNPPLRAKEDRDALIEGISSGIMEAISTDHAPHSEEEKARPIAKAPFGIVGSETALPLTMTYLVHTGKLTPYEMVRRMSYSPAQIIGIDRGSLEEGKIADITIIDPDKEYTIRKEDFVSKGKNTPFEGFKVRGKVMETIVGGKIVYSGRE